MNGDDQCSAQALPSWSVTVIVVHSCWMLIAHQIFSLHDDNEKTENNSYFHSDQLLDRQINNDLFSLSHHRHRSYYKSNMVYPS